MRVLAVLAALMTLAVAAPAHADWQWTKWGMTPEEVTAASGGKTVEDSKEGLILQDPLVVQGCSFQVSFTFDDRNKLEAVVLYSKKGCYSEMVVALTSIYGVAITSDENHRMFSDAAKGNKISIISVLGSTIIKYQPLPTGL